MEQPQRIPFTLTSNAGIEFNSAPNDSLLFRLLDALTSINAEIIDESPTDSAVKLIGSEKGYFNLMEKNQSVEMIPSDNTSVIDDLIPLLTRSQYFEYQKSNEERSKTSSHETSLNNDIDIDTMWLDHLGLGYFGG